MFKGRGGSWRVCGLVCEEILPPRRSESERQTTHKSGSESSLEDYFVYGHTDSREHCSSSGLEGPYAVCFDCHGWRSLQLVYGADGQHERPVDQVQEGPAKEIWSWFHLGFILLPVSADDTTLCFSPFRKCSGSGHEKMVGSIISPRRRATTAFQ